MRIVVIGGGGVGQHLASAVAPGAAVIVVDPNPEALAEVEERVDALTLCGNGTHRDTLRKAEVHKADLVVAVSDNDTANITAAALASGLGARRSVARVDDPGFYDTTAAYERSVLGVHAVLCASRLVSGELLRMLTGRDCRHTFALAGGALHGAIVEVGEGSPALAQAPQRLATAGSEVVRAVVRGGRVRAAAEVTSLGEGDALLMVGNPIDVARVVRYVRDQQASRAVLIGGGEIGSQLAASMSRFENDVRLLEQDRARCETLAATLPDVRVIHGDGTNLSLLRDERIGLCGSMCAVTQSDEVNLMASLLGQELGVKRTLALVHRPGYAQVYDHLGIHGTTSAHEVLASVLRWMLPGRRIVTRAGLPGTDDEVIEARVPPIDGRRLTPRDLPLPVGSVLLGTRRPDGTSARSDDDLVGGEHVVVAMRSGQGRELERAFEKLGGRKDPA